MKIDQSARDHLEKVLQPGQYLKVAIVGGGCNGLSYTFDTTETTDGMTVIERVAIDKKSMMFLKNSLLVYRSTPFSGILSIVNPDAKSTCGCGESFSV